MTRSRCNYFFSFMVILFPILNQYSIGISGVTLGDILLIIASLFCCICGNTIYFSKSKKDFLIFIVYIYFISIISFCCQDTFQLEVLTRMIRYLFYFFLIIVCSDNFRLKNIYKPYKHICIGISIYILFQKLFYELFEIILPNRILPLQWYANIANPDEIALGYSRYFFQARGIFTEPGFVAHYLLPCLIFLIYETYERKKGIKLFNIAVILLALWFTKSVQAIVLGLAVLVLYLLKNLSSKKQKDKKKSILLIFPAILIIIGAIQSKTGQIIIEKVTNHIYSGGSVSLRLFRGYAIFAEIPAIFKLLGVGIGNLDFYVINNSLRTIFDPSILTLNNAGYVNGISSILLYGGIIGIILYFRFYKNLLKNTNQEQRMLAVIYIILLFGEGVIFSGIGMFYLMFIFSGIQKEQSNI